MKNLLNELIEKAKNNRQKTRRYGLLLAALAVVTILGVSWGLHQNGISMTASYVCGKEEHVHTDACYTQKLICGKEESEGTAGHTHTDECYEEQQVLTCTNEDPDHEHTDECYTTERVLICGKEESEGTEGHTHTDACYEKELTCGKEEHTHTVACYGSDISADVETPSDWEATIPYDQLTGVWADDLITVAKSQLGYKESTKNFNVDENGKKKGYTRYGAWYGNEYGDWCAMFASFCLNYADISTDYVPRNSGCAAWIEALTEAGLYNEKSEYSPGAGDLVFFDNRGNDGRSDHVGIVEEVTTDDDGHVISFKTIEGNASDMVKEREYNIGAGNILGYAVLPENPELTQDEASEAKTASDWEDEEDAENASDDNGSDEGVAPQSDDTAKSMSALGFVSGLTGSGTTYDATTNRYSSNLTLNFSFTTATVRANGLSYYYEYPEGVIIPDSLIDETNRQLYDSSGRQAGTYTYEKTSAGRYRVNITLLEDYVADTGESIPGYISFNGQLDGSKGKTDGSIEITGDDNISIVIPSSEIKYPDGTTNAYDISSTKTGSYKVQDGKLVYTVTVFSLKGTPADITYTDVITANGMTLGTPSVTVTKQEVPYYTQIKEGAIWWRDYWEGTPVDTGTVDVTQTYSDGTISMTLPKISEATEKEDEYGNSYRAVTKYTITYTYDVTELTSETPSVKNTVNVNSKDSTVKVKSKSEYTINISNKHSMTKGGWYDASQGNILWTITVNSTNVDIAGSELTDTMLKALPSASDITITPSAGYEIETDKDGKVTGIKFTAVNGEKNTNTYIIQYRTPVEASFDDQIVTNTAYFKPGDGSGTIDAPVPVTVPGGSIAKTAGTGTESSDGQTLIIPWTITVTVPESGIPKDTVITDDPTQDSGGTQGATQYMTRSQVLEWANGMCWVDASGNTVNKVRFTDGNDEAEVTFKASDGNTYTYKQISDNSGGVFDNLTYTVYTIKLKNNLSVPDGAKSLKIEYKTTADISKAEIGSTYFKNRATAGSKTADASYEYKKGGIIKTDENNISDTTTKTNSTGDLSWKLTATLASQSSQLTITDTLPDGVKLTSIQIDGNWANFTGGINIDENGNISGSSGYYEVSGTYKDNVVTLVLTLVEAQLSGGNKLSAGSYTFKLNCKVDKGNITDYEAGKTYTFKNTASAKDDSGDMGSADQTQEWTEKTDGSDTKVISKSGAWDNENRRVKYSIAINPDGKDILEGVEQLTLKDVFTYRDVAWAAPENSSEGTQYSVSAYLVHSSVKLYKAVKQEDGMLVKGEEITNWSWTLNTADVEKPDWQIGQNHTSTITATGIPDETPLIFEYDYQVETNIPDGYHSTSALTISNSAVLEGTDYKDDKTQSDTEWDKSETTGQVTTDKQYVLYKVAKGNYGKTLPGATFKLQRYENGSYVDADVTYTTDKDGKIVIKWQKSSSDTQYEYNTLYRVIETAAPTGYNLPDDVEANAIYFYFSSENNTTHTLPSDLPEEAVNLTKGSHTVYVENESQNTEITVAKKWVNFDGTTNTGKTGSVTFDLYRMESTTEAPKTGSGTLSGEIRIGAVSADKIWQTIESQTHPAGTTVAITLTIASQYNTDVSGVAAPTIMVNGTAITPTEEKTTDATWGNVTKRICTYTFTMGVGNNVITGYTGWDTQYYKDYSITVTEPTTTAGTKIGTYTITAENGWQETIANLPATGTNADGQKVYYSYYIQETGIDPDSYAITYDNNGGIVTGTITVTNTETKNPSYDLPESGGMGTIPFTAGGAAMIGAGLMYGYSLRRRGKRGGE